MTARPCTDQDCPCEGGPTLARLYALRAIMGLAAQCDLAPMAEYDALCTLVAAHEAAWGKAVARG